MISGVRSRNGSGTWSGWGTKWLRPSFTEPCTFDLFLEQKQHVVPLISAGGSRSISIAWNDLGRKAWQVSQMVQEPKRQYASVRWASLDLVAIGIMASFSLLVPGASAANAAWGQIWILLFCKYVEYVKGYCVHVIPWMLPRSCLKYVEKPFYLVCMRLTSCLCS